MDKLNAIVDKSLYFYPEPASTQWQFRASDFTVASVSAGRDLSPPANFHVNDGLAKALSAMRHGTTAELISNLLRRTTDLYNQAQPALPRGRPGEIMIATLPFVLVTFTINIGGHGAAGFLETGAGQAGPQNQENTVSNYTNWRRYFPGPHMPVLIDLINLYSCDTGAGTRGAQFVFNMAKQFQATVRARTGLTLINAHGKMDFENGSTWQEAKFDMQQPPPPIEAPIHFVDLQLAAKQLVDTNETIALAPDFMINLLQIQRLTISVFNSDGNQTKEVLATALIRASQFIFAQPIFKINDEIAGLITAIIRIVLPNATLDINLYNNRLGKITQSDKALFIYGFKEFFDSL